MTNEDKSKEQLLNELADELRGLSLVMNGAPDA